MSTITKEDVETVIYRAVSPDAKVLNYKLEPFTQMKNGILGSHTLLSVRVCTSSSRNDDVNVSTRTFFLKTPPDSAIQDLIMDEGIFEEEVNFHNDIQPLMLADYNGEKWCPKCYLAKGNALVYEDLRVQGFTTPTELLINKTFLKSALATLARFHAASLLAEAKLGRSLKQAYPKYFAEKLYCDHNKHGRLTKDGFEAIVLMAEKFGLDSSLVLPHLYNCVSNKVKPKKGHVNVVCHSDLWKNNIMFNRSNECVMVDYQILRYASPAVDVAMLVYLNTMPEFRKTGEIEIFKHYYSVFQETLRKSKRDIQIPSYDYMLKEYLNHRIVGMTYAALYLPGIYLKPDDIMKLMNDPKALTYFFSNRFKFINLEIDSNPVYAIRLKAILTELLDETRQTLNP
ncbi:uncharacterized protein LOC131672047 [Phymastichus coffea]|uniref:uncharacterized protein LOC131672047 n=1 Tax=Phymastichus coffea TaxID=108790 RepID=UPI00273C63A2|nr:uncharacterized protein LOC131672047 [Phymastichus coffea]